jgi:hypothetical protein
VLAALLIAGCASEQSATPDSPSPPAPEGEQLIGQPPVGWIRIGAANIAGMRTAQYVPEGEDGDDWTRRIRFEALAEQPLPDPLDFLELIHAEQRSDCAGFEAFPTFAGFENGYPTAVSLLVCARNHSTGMPALTLIKAIQGNEYFYVISRSGRGADYVSPDSTPVPRRGEEAPDTPTSSTAAQDAVAAWAVYLKSISLCDPAREEHPCPTGERILEAR